MSDFEQLIKGNYQQVMIFVERSDGIRTKLIEANDLDQGKLVLEQFCQRWLNDGRNRKIERIDDVTRMLFVGKPVARGSDEMDWMALSLVYIDPLPERPKHDGDVRVDRKRKPIP